MRIIVEQSLPTDLGDLRKFVDQATKLVDGDVTAMVREQDGWLRITASKDLQQL